MRCALLLSLLLLSCGLIAGCGGGSSGGLGDGGALPAKAGLRIYVTDAPFPGELVESATVVINEVRVREKDQGGWLVVFEGEEEIDLVPLSGGVSSLLVDVELEPGVYDEVRLIVDAGEVVLKPEAEVANDSHVFNVDNGGLHFPSGAQTGIKVKVDNEITVVTELTSDLTLDFDLSKNFVFNGPPAHPPGVKRVIFTPVVRAVNSSTAGTVEMEVWSNNATEDTSDDFLLADATVLARDGDGAEAGGGLTNKSGFFSLQLPGGTYTIEFEATGHDPQSREDVQVAAANLVRLNPPVLLEASSGAVLGTVFSNGGTTGVTEDDIILEGVTVTATLQGEVDPAATTTTDNQGAYRFAELVPGTYDLAFSVAAGGFKDGSVVGVVPTTAGTVVLMTLEALTQNLTGTVTDVDANVIAGVEVTVFNAAGIEVATTTTDDLGVYAVSLGTGTYKVEFLDPVSENSATVEGVTIAGTDPETDQVLDQQL